MLIFVIVITGLTRKRAFSKEDIKRMLRDDRCRLLLCRHTAEVAKWSAVLNVLCYVTAACISCIVAGLLTYQAYGIAAPAAVATIALPLIATNARWEYRFVTMFFALEKGPATWKSFEDLRGEDAVRWLEEALAQA